MGVTLLLKPAHVVAQLMLAPVVWGEDERGGDTTLNNNEDITGVTQVNCGGEACAGIKTNGLIVAWGSSGGDVQGKDVIGMAQVVCGSVACSGVKTDGSAVAWGASCCGGGVKGADMTGMAQVVCTGGACAGLKTDGSVVAWGLS